MNPLSLNQYLAKQLEMSPKTEEEAKAVRELYRTQIHYAYQQPEYVRHLIQHYLTKSGRKPDWYDDLDFDDLEIMDIDLTTMEGPALPPPTSRLFGMVYRIGLKTHEAKDAFFVSEVNTKLDPYMDERVIIYMMRLIHYLESRGYPVMQNNPITIPIIMREKISALVLGDATAEELGFLNQTSPYVN